jgi:hypothetical protein
VSAGAPAAHALGVGRTFVGPAFDLLLIGGGLTFPVAAWLFWDGSSAAAVIGLSIPVVALLVNQAHFAASTLRLYTKPGSFQSLPLLTMMFPLATLLALSGAVALAGDVGRHLWALSLTWSPFHYAAQTFGLASMYCYRSGCRLSAAERRWLRGACLLPFFKAFLSGTGAGYGLGWLVPAARIADAPELLTLYQLAVWFLDAAAFLAPLALFAWLALRRAPTPSAADPAPRRLPGMPLISLSVMLSNATWFVFFDYFDAFVWATVFHGLQYLAIVCIFHTQDRLRAPDNRRGPAYHVLWFYGICVTLGYGLFQCWPYAYRLAGFGMVESMLMVIAVINIHHFVVDAYIWRLRRDRNYQTVIGTPAG